MRIPGLRVLVALAFATWVLVMAFPDCHLFPSNTSADHAHIESDGPAPASRLAVGLGVDPHQHVTETDRHLTPDAMPAALPRNDSALVILLLIATALVVGAAPQAMALGHALRAPPGHPPAASGRDILIRFGIARN